MTRKAAAVFEKKPVYMIPERLWRIEDVMAFMGLERETATDLVKQSGAYFQHNRVYYIHPVAFELWIEKKIEESTTHGQKEEGTTTTP